MSNYYLKLIAVLAILFSFACEDTDDETTGGVLEGTWTASLAEYDETCEGESEDFGSSTWIFSGSTASFTEEQSFEDWCDGTITDGVCDEDGYTYEMSDFEDECDGSYSNGVCTSTSSGTYTTDSDSMYLAMTASLDLSDEEYEADENSYELLCTLVGGTLSGSICTVSQVASFGLTISGSSATLTSIYIGEDDYDDSYCDIFTMTKQ